jgi:hypothetical protein
VLLKAINLINCIFSKIFFFSNIITMGGGLMQLVAYGAQDVYLTGNPQITFWKVTYRRYTNFAIESIEQTFNGQADFGRRVQCTISRNGDLAYRTYLQVTLPEINQLMGIASYAAGVGSGVYARWLDYPGEQLIAQVEVEIGGQRIDRQYGDWMHIWNQLTMTSEQQRGYFKMIGNTTQLTFITDPSFAEVDGPCDSLAPRQVCAPRNALPETTLYVPLQFWFCTNPGLALPLIALKSVGQKSIQPKVSEHCFRKNLLEFRDDLYNHQPQMLVACC